MNEQLARTPPAVRDYSETLFLPKTEFPMRAGLPQREPLLLKRWAEIDLYGQLRRQAAGRPRFVLHDGPPYANGNIHIGHALNKVLKDLVTRSQQMLGFDSNYVPGWDCHGLPIEWKIEEEYRARGKNKDEVPIVDFPARVPGLRREVDRCSARRVQAARRRGGLGSSLHDDGLPGRGADRPRDHGFRAHRPALSRIEARDVVLRRADGARRGRGRVPREDVPDDLGRVPGHADARRRSRRCVRPDLDDHTLDDPANRAIVFGSEISYGLYEVTEAAADNWARVGSRYVLADKLAGEVFGTARVAAYSRVKDVLP
jgi:isoleucyl-tRNA synthetase